MLQMHTAYWSILILGQCGWLVCFSRSAQVLGDSVVCHVTRVVIIGLWQILSIEMSWNGIQLYSAWSLSITTKKNKTQIRFQS